MASSLEALEDVQKDLLEAQSCGEFALGEFVERRIRANNTFYGPIKRCKLRKFVTMKARKISNVDEKAVQ